MSQAPMAHSLVFQAASKKEKTRRQSATFLSGSFVEDSDSEREDGEPSLLKAKSTGASSVHNQQSARAGKKKKRLKQSQGEWDQLANRLMDYLPPRILDLESREAEEIRRGVRNGLKSSHNNSAKDLIRLENIANPDLVRLSH